MKIISPATGYTGLTAEKVGRNAPCRCGSGRKAKNCCGNTTAYFNREKQRLTIMQEKEREHIRSKNAE